MCNDTEDSAGPLNNWRDPEQKSRELMAKFSGAMRGRTMYVVPFMMGPPSSPFSKIGIQLTDSPYVVASMRIMTRMGKVALDALAKTNGEFVPCLHTVGQPLSEVGEEDSPWPCNKDKEIVHFPEQRK